MDHIVDSHPPRRLDPRWGIGFIVLVVIILVVVFFGVIWIVQRFPAFYATNWGWFLPLVILGILLLPARWTAPMVWDAMMAIVKYRRDDRVHRVVVDLIEETKLAIHDARTNNHSMDLTFNDQMLPISVKITPAVRVAGAVSVQEVAQNKPAPLQLAAPQGLPGPMLLRDVMSRWDLRPDNLFLAFGKGMQAIGCSLEGFMHVAHDAPTGGGKTSQFYGEIAQLVKCGVRVLLANPHFTPHGKKAEEDYRPLARAIEQQGLIEVAPNTSLYGLLRKYHQIVKVLEWLSLKEIDRRFVLREQGIYSYQPIYLFIDEWPAIVRRHPEAAGFLVDVLQRGRAVDVCVNVNAQGFLQNDVDLKGSARENFNTAYHMGGSVHSGSRLLDMPVREINALLIREQVVLGKGIALLRNNQAAPEAQLVRLPYAEKQFFQYLFGPADDYVLPEYRTIQASNVYTRRTEPLPQHQSSNVSISGNDWSAGNGVSDTLETAVEAERERKDSALPASSLLPSEEVDTSGVSAEIRETVRRMKTEKMPDRKIAKFVGLAGRKYAIYQAVCRELGFGSEPIESEG